MGFLHFLFSRFIDSSFDVLKYRAVRIKTMFSEGVTASIYIIFQFAYACVVYAPLRIASSFGIVFYGFNFVPTNLLSMLQIENSGENFSHDLGLKPDSPCVHDGEKRTLMLRKQMDNSHVTSCYIVPC